MTMSFAPPSKKPRTESIVPMINVVFLLLIFFLMTSTLSRPEPFEVTPPIAENGAASDVAPILYLATDGRLAFDDEVEDAAIVAFMAAYRQADQSVAPQLRADAQTPGNPVWLPC